MYPESGFTEPYKEDDLCHCGEPIYFHNEPWYEEPFTRGLCSLCDMVRCDAYPGDCGR